MEKIRNACINIQLFTMCFHSNVSRYLLIAHISIHDGFVRHNYATMFVHGHPFDLCSVVEIGNSSTKLSICLLIHNNVQLCNRELSEFQNSIWSSSFVPLNFPIDSRRRIRI